MTTSVGYESGEPQDGILAGEYVLGTLSSDARRQVEARMADDAAFAALVRDWQQRLEPLDEDYGEIAPPAHAFNVIEDRLFGAEPAVRQSWLAALWGSVALWRGVALAALVVAVVAAGLNANLFAPSGPTLSAELSGPDNTVNLVARFNARNGMVSITPVAAGAANDKSLELWLIEGDNPPLSLGVLPQTGEGEVVVPRNISDRIGAGAAFAITIEPFGGSPTGKATGPIIAAGELRSL